VWPFDGVPECGVAARALAGSPVASKLKQGLDGARTLVLHHVVEDSETVGLHCGELGTRDGQAFQHAVLTPFEACVGQHTKAVAVAGRHEGLKFILVHARHQHALNFSNLMVGSRPKGMKQLC
jgi:hypothetical protein